MHFHLEQAAKALGIKLANLETASNWSERKIKEFGEAVAVRWTEARLNARREQLDLVLHGSLSRREATVESDCDFVVLQNGCEPDYSQALLQIADSVRESFGFAEPGRQGVFGDVVIAPLLYERIGLDSDSNQNLTHRILLVTESVSVFDDDTRKEVIKKILSRYCADYRPPRKEAGKPAKVPRHFVNDLVRFWRTMAVDFGAKRWRGGVKDNAYLRLLKLRTTRKILFAGPLCSLLLVPDRTKTTNELAEYLAEWLGKPPLSQLASLACDDVISPRMSPESKEALKDLLLAYDGLLGLFTTARKALKADEKSSEFRTVRNACEDIAARIERSLEQLFFEDVVFAGRFRQYAVF